MGCGWVFLTLITLKFGFSILVSGIPKLPQFPSGGVSTGKNTVASPVTHSFKDDSDIKKATPLPLPEATRKGLPRPEGQASTFAYGDAFQPYSTSAVYGFRIGVNGWEKTEEPANLFPYSAIGKLTFTIGLDSYSCSASLVAPHVAVTAAHCVVEFGSGGSFYSDINFYGSNTEKSFLYKSRVLGVIAPGSYVNGYDVCNPNASGVVCENDLAILYLDWTESANSSTTNKSPGNVGGYLGYSTSTSEYFINFLGMDIFSAQITEVGYPGNLDYGLNMMRTDSLGFAADYNQVMIGSGMEGGSSGGPWIVNFGNPPQDSSQPAYEDQSSIIIGTTSWGYRSETVKQQGASRFGTNTAFSEKSNIETLMEALCCSFDQTGRDIVCGARVTDCPSDPITSVVGVSPSGAIYYASDVTQANWVQVPGYLSQVSLSGSSLAGASPSGAIYYASDVTQANWVQVPGYLSQVSLSGSLPFSSQTAAKPTYSPSAQGPGVEPPGIATTPSPSAQGPGVEPPGIATTPSLSAQGPGVEPPGIATTPSLSAQGPGVEPPGIATTPSPSAQGPGVESPGIATTPSSSAQG